MKKHNRKGFTLMEMLIVVAIIAILIAVAIPTFSSALTKSKEATDEANFRALKGLIVTAYLTEELEEGTLALPVSGATKFYYLSSDGSSVVDAGAMPVQSTADDDYIGYKCEVNTSSETYTFEPTVVINEMDSSLASFEIKY